MRTGVAGVTEHIGALNDTSSLLMFHKVSLLPGLVQVLELLEKYLNRAIDYKDTSKVLENTKFVKRFLTSA